MSKPVILFAEISRVDDEARIVEGFCYVNSRVKTDPWDLPVDVLRVASVDYMRWANVREMHDNKAIGTALDLTFQDDGKVFIRSEIVDDQAWAKVRKGVYKGFSVKGRPEVVRGSQVQKFTWLETSLVDRPADPEAVVTLWRRDGDAEAEPEHVEVERAGSPAPDYAAGDAGVNDPPPANLEVEASQIVNGHQHYDCGSELCHKHLQRAAAQRCADAQMVRADLFVPDNATDEEAAELVRLATTPAAEAASPADAEEIDEMTLAEVTARMDTIQAGLDALIARLDSSSSDETLQRLDAATTAMTETSDKLARVESDLAAAQAELKRIGDQPVGAPVVRFQGALVRSVTQRFGEGNVTPDMLKKIERFEELNKMSPPADAKDREKMADEVMTLQRELRAAALL